MFGIADQQAWHGRDHRDWREVSDQIERQFRIERCVDRVAGEADQPSALKSLTFQQFYRLYPRFCLSPASKQQRTM